MLPGATVTFSATAAGTGLLSYQWKSNGAALFDDGRISGSQTPTLTLPGVTYADAANYTAEVSGGCGSNAVSVAAALTLPLPLQPRTVPAGDTVTLVVGAAGPANAPLAYQWSWNGTALPGATASAYLLSNAQATNSGTYAVVVSNIGSGTAVSMSTMLTVSAHRLRLYPTNLAILRAGDGVAPLANTGNPLFVDQFTTNGDYLNSIMIPDSGPSALIGGSALTDHYMGAAANGRAVLFGGFNTSRPYSGAIASSSAVAVPRGIGSVNGLGYYSLALSDTNALYNSGRMLGVTSTDGQTQFWTVGGAGLVYLAPSLGPDVVVTNGGRYSVTIFNGDLYASFSSLNGSLWQFTGLPTNAASGTLVLQQTGNPNDFALSPDGNTLYLTSGSNVGAGLGGIQRWDKADGVWSFTYYFPTPVTTTTGNNGPDGVAVDFSGFTGGGASGVGAVVYATTGEATANNLIKLVDMGAGSPVVVVATAGPNQVMRGIRFAPVADAVSIAVQPQNQSAPAGGTATFSVVATGSAPFSYQWSFKNAPIADATQSTLILTNVQAGSAGSYSVVVSNDISSMTSSNALLTVTAGPPLLQIALNGATVVISWTNAVPGTTYRVQFKPELTATTWTDLPPDVVAGATTASKTDTLGAAPRFYRVILP